MKTKDYPTLSLLMKSFMDCETEPVIPHLIEEVPDFKSFVEGYLGRGGGSFWKVIQKYNSSNFIWIQVDGH